MSAHLQLNTSANGQGQDSILWDLLDDVYVPLSMIDRLKVTGAAIGNIEAGSGQRVAANGKVYVWAVTLQRVAVWSHCSENPLCTSDLEKVWGWAEVVGVDQGEGFCSGAMCLGLLRGAGNFATGATDVFSLGLTALSRQGTFYADVVEEGSITYVSGAVAGTVIQTVVLPAAAGQNSWLANTQFYRWLNTGQSWRIGWHRGVFRLSIGGGPKGSGPHIYLHPTPFWLAW